MKSEKIWPALPYEEWKDTLEALHMKMQIPGKVKLGLNPFLNQWWHVAFHLTASGMTTGLIPFGDFVFEINFDFTNHHTVIRTSDRREKIISLVQCSVAEYYIEFMNALYSLGINIKINTLPAEVPNPVHCDEDTRRAYDKKYVFNWWQVLIQAGKIMEQYRSTFRGKQNPVLFYWGSFDLNVTRYNGKTAPLPKQGGRIMEFSEDEENFSCGFWAGSETYPKPAFYSYIYPAQKEMESLKIKPDSASFNSSMGEFILDYDEVRKSSSPGELLLEFFNSTYHESAKLAGWDLKSLKTRRPG